MRRNLPIGVMAACLALFFSTAASGQGFVDGVGRLIDGVGSILQDFGNATEKLVPRGFGNDTSTIIDLDNDATATSAKSYGPFPAPPGVTVSIEHNLGEVHIEAWDQNEVSVQADITVGAETPELANSVLEEIKVQIDTNDPQRISIKTIYPPVIPDYKINAPINYLIKVPRTANVVCTTNICRTVVRGIAGRTTVMSFGDVVDLADLTGPVTVRGGGQTVFAHRLMQGGDFVLNGCESEFSEISGVLYVNSVDGSASFKDMGSATQVNVFGTNAPLHFYLSPGANPQISANVVLGKLMSDIPLINSGEISNTINARSPDGANPGQQVNLTATFADLYIHSADGQSQPTVPLGGQPGSVKELEERNVPVAPGTTLVLHTIPGNITIEGAETDSVTISGSQSVQVTTGEQATAAQDMLALTIDTGTDGTLAVTTATTGDMDTVGCTYWRVDLRITCPTAMAIELTSAGGENRIASIFAPVEVTQERGSISIDSVDGELNLQNRRGDVEVRGSTGPATVSAQSGEISLDGVIERQTVSGEDCTVIIQSPGSTVNVRNTGGDVRILALDGIFGRYDIGVSNGNIDFKRNDDADVDFTVTIENGHVDGDTNLDLYGSYNGKRWKLSGGQNQKSNPVDLSVINGNVSID